MELEWPLGALDEHLPLQIQVVQGAPYLPITIYQFTFIYVLTLTA